MLINKRELWKLLLPAEGIITTVKIEVRLKIVMFLTALYFQPFSLSFCDFCQNMLLLRSQSDSNTFNFMNEEHSSNQTETTKNLFPITYWPLFPR